MTAEVTTAPATTWELDQVRRRVDRIRSTRAETAIVAVHRAAGRHRTAATLRANSRPPRPLPGLVAKLWRHQGHTRPVLVRVALDLPRWPLAVLWGFRARHCHHPLGRATTTILWVELALIAAAVAVTAWAVTVPPRIGLWLAGEALVLRGWTRPPGSIETAGRLRVGQRDREAQAAGRIAEIQAFTAQPLQGSPQLAPAGHPAMAYSPPANGMVYQPYPAPMSWSAHTPGRTQSQSPRRRLIKGLWWTSVAVGSFFTLVAWTLALLSAASVIGPPPTAEDLNQRTTPSAMTTDAPTPDTTAIGGTP
jgi:hypothetical protein